MRPHSSRPTLESSTPSCRLGKVNPLRQNYEYKFIRLGEGLFSVKKKARLTYRDAIAEQTRDGWRLVQIFAPTTSTSGGAPAYYEIILERLK